MAGIKIVDLPALGRDLAATDLLELSLAGGTGSRKITGQEIINASKLNVGTTPIINGTAGRLLFQGTGDILQQSGNLFWDNTNVRLGIGTSSVSQTLTIQANSTDNGILLQSPTGNPLFIVRRDGNSLHGAELFQYSSGVIRLAIRSSSNFSYFNGGNFGFGTTTDAGFKLDVNGTARVTDLTIGTPSVDNNIRFGGNNTRIFNSIADNSLNYQSVFSASTVFRFTTNSSLPNANTSGTNVFMSLPIGFAPTSGTGTWTQLSLTPTINQTGGANGITRGLHITPTLTSAADFRAIETTTGNVIFNGGNVGIGTSSPANKLDIKGTGDVVLIDSNAVASRVTLKLNTTSASYTQIIGNGTELNLATLGSTHITFATNSSERVRIGSTTGNVLINTTTDAGYRLDVNGTARVSGRITIGSDIIPSAAGSSVALAAHVAAGSILDLSYYTGSQNALSSTKSVIFHGITFSPSSGTAIFNQLNFAPILNQTGTANGAVRGFYYNPTVTSVLGPHWAIHTTAGRVRFEGLPTSPTGLNAGDIYNDGGTLRIV